MRNITKIFDTKFITQFFNFRERQLENREVQNGSVHAGAVLTDGAGAGGLRGHRGGRLPRVLHLLRPLEKVLTINACIFSQSNTLGIMLSNLEMVECDLEKDTTLTFMRVLPHINLFSSSIFNQ